MEKKKGLWSSLFRKEETVNLPAVLQNEYGIEIAKNEKSLAEINALGYGISTKVHSCLS